MNFKFDFKLTNESTDEEFLENDGVELKLGSGETVRGYLEHADSVSLTLERRNSSEEYDFSEIESIKKVI